VTSKRFIELLRRLPEDVQWSVCHFITSAVDRFGQDEPTSEAFGDWARGWCDAHGDHGALIWEGLRETLAERRAAERIQCRVH
jgi:hypothetical protein